MNEGTKPGAAVLVPEQEVCGHVVKPWTLAQAIELTEDIEDAAKTLAKKGMTLDKFQENPVELVKAIAPRLPRFMGVTLGIPEEEAGGLPLADATLIALTIVRQNLNHLKNLLGPVSQALQALALEMSSGSSSGPSKPSSPEDTANEQSSTNTGLTS